MSLKRLVIDGYGQLELNQVAFRRDGRIEAQCPLSEEIEYIEKKNGKKLGFAMRPYPNRRSTGNPLIDRYRFFTKEDEEKWFKKLMKRRTR